VQKFTLRRPKNGPLQSFSLENCQNGLHPKSTGLADEGELGFMKSVEAQFERIVVAPRGKAALDAPDL
jgi:hypothetical protein